MIFRKLHGYKYETLKEEFFTTNIYPDFNIVTRYITLDITGMLRVRKHYAWDGASGPTIDDETNYRGSLAHDALYQLMRENKLSRVHRKECDKVLRDVCLEDGMNKLRAWYYYVAVRKFSKKSSMSRKNPRGVTVRTGVDNKVGVA